MNSYAQLEIFSMQEQVVYRRATELVADAPTKIDDRLVRCHELARAVCERLKKEAAARDAPLFRKLCHEMNVMDGYYGMIEHSFILLGELYEGGFGPMPHVLDVYAPGRVPQVQLVDTSSVLPFYYRRGAPRSDVNQDDINFIHGFWQPIEAP
jgi:hypothetical protein